MIFCTWMLTRIKQTEINQRRDTKDEFFELLAPDLEDLLEEEIEEGVKLFGPVIYDPTITPVYDPFYNTTVIPEKTLIHPNPEVMRIVNEIMGD